MEIDIFDCHVQCMSNMKKIKSGRPVIVTGRTDFPKIMKLKRQRGTGCVILPKLTAYRYRGCVLFWKVFCNQKSFLPDTYRINWQMTKYGYEYKPLNISQIQSNTNFKHCNWWRNIGLIFRTRKYKTEKSEHDRKPVVAKRTINTKKRVCLISSCDGIQISMLKDNGVTCRYMHLPRCHSKKTLKILSL